MNLNELTPQEREQYKEVASELRCLVCQNQSLADSHASLAVDLKEKIAEQIREGKTNAEIKSYMQDRYGEFVIYKPAYSPENAVLWLGPFLVLVFAVWLARRSMRGEQVKVSKSPSEDWAEAMYRGKKGGNRQGKNDRRQ
ncbi:cytochrome c-type biogenesis protein CcmH [Limnobacter sp.]|uniref:cytochrome c-type biogenesis protein n=1 Tax=Limnobacter sp. TaxID=2003368 RepID=UPI0035122509